MLKRALSIFEACANPRCSQTRMGSRLRFSGMRVGQDRYCSPACLHDGLTREFHDLLHGRKHLPRRQHRIPLGLLLMSRGDIDEPTLKAAVQAQKLSPGVRLGRILIDMKAVTEDQVTTAVASQWSVPVFRLTKNVVPEAVRLVPFALMERYRMMPVHYVRQRNHLHLAFVESLDRTLVYAIERMLGVTTESSIARESELLPLLRLAAQQTRPAEYVLNTVAGEDLAGIVRGYALRLRSEQINASLCGDQLWVRASGKREPTHFLLGVPVIEAVARR